MITTRSRTIGRDKLGELTGNDHEMIKFLEGTQADAANAIGGANDALTAATAAQETAEAAQITADQAADDAALAIGAAAAAQAAAVAAQGVANAAQLDATQALSDADDAQSTANSALNLASDIDADYISRTMLPPQAVLSTFQAPSYLVAGLQVVGPRVTGWTAATGTALLGAFNSNTTYAAGVVYLQAEATAAYAGLTEARQRIKALEEAMRTHGLIN